MKNCPRCASEITKNMKTCPRCGLPVSQMDEFVKKFNLTVNEDEPESAKAENPVQPEKKLSKKERKLQKKAEKKAKKERESKSDTNFSQLATNGGFDFDDDYKDDDTFSERKRKRKSRLNRPIFDIDENGEFNIDTTDVEIVGEETGKIIDERFEQSYSIKKSRGDFRPPRVKWWEIYKLADRHFARRKIKKEVNKAARIRPSFINKTKLLLLAIFIGWSGAQNFYAKNKRKGWVSLITLVAWIGITLLARSVTFFSKIEISVGGLAGLTNLLIWITDIFNIIFNKFKFRLQIDKFISEMNVETRAKLGEKYIDLELYFSPWWVKFKAKCQKLKRNYQEYKRDRRQANIDKQKRKEAEKLEKEKIEREINDFENREQKTDVDFVSKQTLDELKSFGEADDEQNSKPADLNGENSNKNSKKSSSSDGKKSKKVDAKNSRNSGQGKNASILNASEKPIENVSKVQTDDDKKTQTNGEKPTETKTQADEKPAEKVERKAKVPAKSVVKKYPKTVKSKKAKKKK